MDGPTLVLVIVLPFLVLSWMAPFFGANTLGRDYVVYSLGNQLELQLALASGEWPVFVPGFAGGAPAPALMLGQLYHPLSHLAAALPGYWSGLALEWNTALRLLSLGLTQLALLAFLRRLGFARALAFGLSFVTVYNLRMLDLFRYGAALEGYTAMLLLCTSLAWHVAQPTPRLGPAAIALSTALLCVSGHPQVTYYGLLAAGIVWCLAPSLVRAVAPELATDPRRARLVAAAAVGVGLAIATVFWLPLSVEFLAGNAARVGQSYGWSTNLQDDALGLASAFALPLRGDVHGGFAGSVLALVALLVPLFAGRSMPRVLWALYAASWVVMLYALGDATPVHRWIWSVLPGQSSIRVPGRATQLLPVFFFWILAWRFRPSQPPRAFRGRTLHAAVWPLLAAVLVSLVLAAALWSEPASQFAPVRIRDVPGPVPWLVLGSGALAALASAFALARHHGRRVAEPVFLVALLVQVAAVLAFGTWVAPKPAMPTLAELRALKQRSLDYPGSYGYGMYSTATLAQLERTFLPPDLARLVPEIERVSTRDAAWQRIAAGRRPDLALLEAPASPDVAAPGVPFSARVELRHAGFNRLAFDTRSDRVAALVFAFGYTPRWEARIDGQRSEVYRANGYEAAVVVPPGSHDVELRYTSPATRIGGIVSLGAMGGGLLWCAFGVPSRRVRVGLATLTGLAVVAAAVAGSRALDGGRGLGTYDRWRAEDAARTADLAYGRPARSSPVADPERLHLFHASRAVDGHPGTSFSSRADDDPWWEVDLGSAQRVGRITLARPPGGAGASSVEVVLADENGAEHTLVARWRDDRIALRVTPERVARRIRIVARGRGLLALSDVTVEGVGSEVVR